MMTKKTILLAIDVVNKKFYIIDFLNGNVDSEHIAHYLPYGNKPDERISLRNYDSIAFAPKK